MLQREHFFEGLARSLMPLSSVEHKTTTKTEGTKGIGVPHSIVNPIPVSHIAGFPSLQPESTDRTPLSRLALATRAFSYLPSAPKASSVWRSTAVGEGCQEGRRAEDRSRRADMDRAAV